LAGPGSSEKELLDGGMLTGEVLARAPRDRSRLELAWPPAGAASVDRRQWLEKAPERRTACLS